VLVSLCHLSTNVDTSPGSPVTTEQSISGLNPAAPTALQSQALASQSMSPSTHVTLTSNQNVPDLKYKLYNYKKIINGKQINNDK